MELVLKQMWPKRKEKGKKTIKLLASREQISPEAAMIFRLLFDILPSAGLPSLFV